jgi:hypothetical protein
LRLRVVLCFVDRLAWRRYDVDPTFNTLRTNADRLRGNNDRANRLSLPNARLAPVMNGFVDAPTMNRTAVRPFLPHRFKCVCGSG